MEVVGYFFLGYLGIGIIHAFFIGLCMKNDADGIGYGFGEQLICMHAVMMIICWLPGDLYWCWRGEFKSLFKKKEEEKTPFLGI